MRWTLCTGLQRVQRSPSAINLSIDLGVGIALPSEVAVFAATGINFYQQINGQLYMLATNNAMRVDSVG
jgi:hypothetical protein